MVESPPPPRGGERGTSNMSGREGGDETKSEVRDGGSGVEGERTTLKTEARDRM